MGARRSTSVALLLAGVCALALLVRVPSWSLSHREPDEVIYWTLAERLAQGEAYGLQGTRLLEQVLPADMYDRPLFHHPPVFAWMLAPFTPLGSFPPAHQAIVVSWLGALLCIVAVASALQSSGSARGVPSLALLLPVLGMALDPLSLFLSRKLWIDLWLAGLVSLGLALVFTGAQRRARARLVVGGVLLGLAALSKLVAVLAFPVAALGVALAWRARRQAPSRAVARDSSGQRAGDLTVELGLSLTPALLLTGLWLVVFWNQYGTLIPWWSAPSPEILARDPFIRAACSRSVWYYGLRFVAVQPLLLVALLGVALAPRVLSRPLTIFALSWLAVFVGALTWIGQSGNSPNFLRYLAPAFPASYVLLGAALGELRGARRALIAALACAAIVYGLSCAWPYLGTSEGNEILSPLGRALGWWQS